MLRSEASDAYGFHASRTAIVFQIDAGQPMYGVGKISDP